MQDKDLSIQIRNLTKVYQFNPKLNQNIRERLFSRQDVPSGKDIVALRDINIDIEKGSVLGIVGDNGSGKSTLLKIISGITHPTAGHIKIDGRVASILEVGTGFHPDLSGRENIYLSGTMMGMAKKEIEEKFQIIVDFSGIGQYIEMPVKHYSSGMFMRLAFSVVAHLNADIILLDEVFSVGDFTFRNKSLEKVIQLSKSNRTMVLVSHNLHSLERTCNYILQLDKGRMVNFGPVRDVVRSYIEQKVLSTLKSDEGGVVSDLVGGAIEDTVDETNQADEQVFSDAAYYRKRLFEVVHEHSEAAEESDENIITSVNHKEDSDVINENDPEAEQKEEDVYRVATDIEGETTVTEKPERQMPDSFSSSKLWEDGLTNEQGDITIHEISCVADQKSGPIFKNEDELLLTCSFSKNYEGRTAIAFLTLYNLEEQVFVAYSGYSKNGVDLDSMTEPGKYNATCKIPSHQFNSGIYSVSVFFIDHDLEERFSVVNPIFFKIAPIDDIGDSHHDNGKYNGALKPNLDWEISNTN